VHIVAVLALERVIAFDLSTPLEVFDRVRLPDGRRPYQVRVCAAAPQVQAQGFAITAPWGLEGLLDADTVIVPGRAEGAPPLGEEVLEALRQAAARGARIASICVGVLDLAATGLLDGLPATTHWAAVSELARRHPQIEVRPDILYVDNGQFLTSAGAAAGLDLCLHMIRRDWGSAVAASAARLAVTPLEREGGQAQFIVHMQPPIPRGSALEPVLAWMEEHLSDEVTLEVPAQRAGMSPRTLGRRFREQTGSTPLQWLLRARVRRAQLLLESTDHTVDRIAGQSGFGSPTAFRERFKRIVGTSPQSYRAAFRSREPG
jgi:transcriptional regulator GlxA family with amidase domain